MSEKQKIFVSTLAVWAAVILALHFLARASLGTSLLSQILGSLTTVVLIYPPVIMGMLQKKSMAYWDCTVPILKQALLNFMWVSLVLFPLSLVGNHFYQKIFFDAQYHAAELPHFLVYVGTQIFLIALPEEFFFRGYLQQNFNEVWPATRKFLGVPFGRAQIFTAIIFALSHSLIAVAWWHAFIFFPALVFGWLREKTGTIWAGVLFHAACNVFSYWVRGHYF